MSEDGKFWFAVWSAGFVAICFLVAGALADDAYTTARIADMVKAGADPIKARCAVFGTSSENRLDCNLLISK